MNGGGSMVIGEGKWEVNLQKGEGEWVVDVEVSVVMKGDEDLRVVVMAVGRRFRGCGSVRMYEGCYGDEKDDDLKVKGELSV
ncbi:hypothetical protein V6N13_107227 [Hibiscus sabdariffa]|uniref:Uncharacterized protein n=1 Tax=Hibiscus sabdariffa TaxID=183260 RepID=A0ABR2SPG0_9ROSI